MAAMLALVLLGAAPRTGPLPDGPRDWYLIEPADGGAATNGLELLRGARELASTVSEKYAQHIEEPLPESLRKRLGLLVPATRTRRGTGETRWLPGRFVSRRCCHDRAARR